MSSNSQNVDLWPFILATPNLPFFPPTTTATPNLHTTSSGHVVSPRSGPHAIQDIVLEEARKGSPAGSRRGSAQSITGGQHVFGAGLPPTEPHSNPRRGSATGSYGLPVPPDWIRGGFLNNFKDLSFFGQ